MYLTSAEIRAAKGKRPRGVCRYCQRRCPAYLKNGVLFAGHHYDPDCFSGKLRCPGTGTEVRTNVTCLNCSAIIASEKLQRLMSRGVGEGSCDGHSAT